MNKAEHAFDPAWALLYARQLEASQSPDNSSAIDARQLFYQLNQSGKNQDVMPAAYAFVRQHLNNAGQADASLQNDEYSKESLANLTVPVVPPLDKSYRLRTIFIWA